MHIRFQTSWSFNAAAISPFLNAMWLRRAIKFIFIWLVKSAVRVEFGVNILSVLDQHAFVQFSHGRGVKFNDASFR